MIFPAPMRSECAVLACSGVMVPETNLKLLVQTSWWIPLPGSPPLNEDAETAATELEVWQAIYEKDVAMMEKSDIIIANLTPFAGASADAGTLIEVGWFLGKGKPIFGYSNTPENFESRMRRQPA